MERKKESKAWHECTLTNYAINWWHSRWYGVNWEQRIYFFNLYHFTIWCDVKFKHLFFSLPLSVENSERKCTSMSCFHRTYFRLPWFYIAHSNFNADDYFLALTQFNAIKQTNIFKRWSIFKRRIQMLINVTTCYTLQKRNHNNQPTNKKIFYLKLADWNFNCQSFEN